MPTTRHHTLLALLPRMSALLLLLAAVIGAERPLNPFVDGTRWITIGDSITQNGAYAHYVDLFYRTRYPDRRVEVLNAGISGDTAAGTLRRFDWDIAPRRGTVATVMLGMNDVGRDFYRQQQPDADALAGRVRAMESYQRNLTQVVERLRAEGTEVILMSPSMYDQTGRQQVPALFGVNEALGTCGEFGKHLAHEKSLSMIDLHRTMTTYNKQLQTTTPDASLVGPDRIHPGHPGHAFMALQILAAQGVQPMVTQVALDAGKLQVLRQDHTEIIDLKREGQSILWTTRAHSLPFPLPDEVTRELVGYPLLEALTSEPLQIVGLAAGVWSLQVDGKTVGSWDAGIWEAGIDLGRLPTTPAFAQAREVARILGERRIRQGKLRVIAYVEHTTPGAMVPTTLSAMEPLMEARVAKVGPDHHYTRQVAAYRTSKPVEDQLRAEMDALDQAAREAAHPRPRAWRVVPADPR